MKAIMVMFDSLNRHMLQPYGGDWAQTPNFQRLARRSVTFDNAYIGSMPCMPARRELHTGRYNFLHRSWGPLEPFDDSMPQILNDNKIHSHLVTDHYHYWEDGGATYHNRFSTFELVRGQEGDHWKGEVVDGSTAKPGDESRTHALLQDQINRRYITEESAMPQAQTFALGMDFIRKNRDVDNWYLQIETFDPHEPFFTQEQWKALYPHHYEGPLFDWPDYAPVTEPPEVVQHLRYEYAALMSMCDHYLGKVLDLMDELDLWDDTLLIVNTDHGFLLGEHDWWAKLHMPWYNELANIPLFIWDPRAQAADQRRGSLVQTIDLPATILEYFDIERPPDMQGLPLRDTIVDDSAVREAALYGVHGGHVNVTDGRYVYMRAAEREDGKPLYNYTLMPSHMRRPFRLDELRGATLQAPFDFTKGCPTLKAAARGSNWFMPEFETLLYDLASDPRQERPLKDSAIESDMIEKMVSLMRANDAPVEQYQRLGIASAT